MNTQHARGTSFTLMAGKKAQAILARRSDGT